MTALDTIKSAIFGNPLDPKKKPSRVGVVKAFTEMQDQLEAAQAGAIVKSTLSALTALTTAPYAGIMAWVMTGAGSGIYENTGSALAPAWTRRGDIPQFLVTGINTGTGTANAIQVTTDRPFPAQDGRALLVIPILETNTASPMTVSINGGTAIPIVSNSGFPIEIGGATSGSYLTGFTSDGKFRLLSEQATAALLAAVEQYTNQAKTYRDEAANYAALAKNNWVVDGPFVGTGALANYPLSVDPGSANNMLVFADGVAQLVTQVAYTLVYVTGVPHIRISLPNGVPFEVRSGSAIVIETPAAGSVGDEQLAAKAVPLAKIINSGATARLIGRGSAGSGNLEEITKEILRDVFLPSGSIIASAFAKYAAQTVLTGGNAFVAGATPLVTAGHQILSLPFTGKAGTNKYRLRYQGMISINAIAGVVIALFEGNTCIHAEAVVLSAANYYQHFGGEIEVPSSTGEKIYSVRVMTTNTSQQMIVNGTASTANFLGTTAPAATLTIEEIKG